MDKYDFSSVFRHIIPILIMRVFKTTQEFQELADSNIFNEPRLLILQASLKVFAEERNPDSTMELFVDDFPHVQSIIMIMRNKFTL